MLHVPELIARETLFSVQNDSFGFKNSCIYKFCGNRLCRKSLNEYSSPVKSLNQVRCGQNELCIKETAFNNFLRHLESSLFKNGFGKFICFERTSSTSIGISFSKPDKRAFSVAKSTFSWLL